MTSLRRSMKQLLPWNWEWPGRLWRWLRGERGPEAVVPVPRRERWSEEPEAYHLRLGFASGDPEAVEVEVRGRDLVLRGQCHYQSEREEGGLHVEVERFGGWQRRIRMPRDVDHRRVRAAVEDGELVVDLPRAA